MAKIRRIIRKSKPRVDTSFDDQLWPVILALFVLGGFMAGTVLAYLHFDDPRWFANASTWLFAPVIDTTMGPRVTTEVSPLPGLRVTSPPRTATR